MKWPNPEKPIAAPLNSFLRFAPTTSPPMAADRKRLREFEEQGGRLKQRKLRGALLAAHKPSYCLFKGVGDCHCGGESHRRHHRERLSRILHNLVRHHNWPEASGVMSVLLQATAKDKSISRNRTKYSVALQLFNNIKAESINSRRIQGVYELWMKKLGHLKNWSTKERFAVQLEFILACLQLGSLEDAYQTSLWVMQQPGFNNDSIANLMVGLVFYQLWYADIPKELQLTNLDSTVTYLQPEVHSDDGVQMSVDSSIDNDALGVGANYGRQCDSKTSVAIHKIIESHESQMESDVSSESSEYSNYSGDLPRASIICSKGLPRWLLPIKFPSSHESMEDALSSMHKKLNKHHYKIALKCFRVALYSRPPVLEAILPFIQMLLLGDEVQEAIDEVEKLSHSLDAPPILLHRMKASLTENFDSGNYAKICIHLEDILKKDPTCSESLTKLSVMHQRGEYESRSLVEMTGHHLDGTYGTCDTWKELASCMLRICQSEEDRISSCSVGCHVNNCYELFSNGEEWRFRARWWLRRHFSHGILMLDISSGDLKLLAYKAAAASHIYGRHFKYVVEAGEVIDKRNDEAAPSFFKLHTRM